MAEPTQASIARLRRFEIKPNRKLGQNFLIDDNILNVIAERAELDAADVVLEIGGGLGVLSEYLAERCAHVFVIEIDDRLRPALEEAVGGRENVTLIFIDAVDLDFATLEPPPGKLVANLPYGVAASTLIKAFYELPELSLACVMTQREVAERLTAAPGGKLYGASSVLAQAVAGDTSMRKLSRNIFHPVPNVDSALVTLRRTAPPPGPGFVRLVHDAFSHRRKPLPGSLALARRTSAGTRAGTSAGTDTGTGTGTRTGTSTGTSHGDGQEPTIKKQAAEALEQLGMTADTRAERLSAADFMNLHDILERAA
ncbi:MAG: ribosomal RNA small subunit methyltransferase A [Actinobacteria bacterium]|nr:ribosomal RNA small subunit methyltransferase A [Actinomycetota bacterium]